MKYYALLLLFLSSTCVFAQKKMVTDMKLDSLTLSERISLRTNAVDWLMLVPNIGIEFDLGKYNWNRNAIALNLRYNWNTSHTFNPGTVYNFFEARAEYRNYWRTRKVDQNLGAHRHIYEKVLSGRRRRPKHPTTTFYRGAYVSYGTFSVKLGKTGYQGTAVNFGGQYGIIRPLYVLASGNSIDLDFGFSAGFSVNKHSEYTYNSETATYNTTKPMSSFEFYKYPVLDEARVGLVYRFGAKSIYNKYRWRYDVDMDYRGKVDRGLIYRQQLRDNDAYYQKIYRYYQDRYDSILILNMRNHESVVNQKLVDTKEMRRQADKARADKVREEQIKLREQQRVERIAQQAEQHKKDSLELVSNAEARKKEIEIRRQQNAIKNERKEEKKAIEKADSIERANYKIQQAKLKAQNDSIEAEMKKSDMEKRKRMAEAQKIQREYDESLRNEQKQKAAEEKAAAKKMSDDDKAAQRELERSEREAQKKRAEALKNQNKAFDEELKQIDAEQAQTEKKAAEDAAAKAKAATTTATKSESTTDDSSSSAYNAAKHKQDVELQRAAAKQQEAAEKAAAKQKAAEEKAAAKAAAEEKKKQAKLEAQLKKQDEARKKAAAKAAEKANKDNNSEDE